MAKPFDPKYTHIRIQDVCDMIFRTQTFVYEQMAKGQFPTPTKLSPAVSVWRKEEIEKWLVESAKSIGSGAVEEKRYD
ncbi:helix-turn-helix transcriptional regulator [Scandinavium sp. NPDC088450]|uniref:helix-turn-helix transcriptional regulator n=1 Tax=Scandinavium sp. NPDC088450 TaxID=3364514 RepID=UPI0038506DE5